MKTRVPLFLKSHGFSLLLILSLIAGVGLGVVYKKDAVLFKPLGDIFLNLLFTVIVPLVFFSISSAVASMTDLRRLGRILSVMFLVFVLTGFIASGVMLLGVILYPPAFGVAIPLAAAGEIRHLRAVDQIVGAFTVSDFPLLLSKNNMLALILFSILTGLATSAVGERGKPFAAFLVSANEVMMKLVSFIMYYAPVGLCAYFAYLVGTFGPELLGSYGRAMALYYPLAVAYYLLAFSLYAFLAGGVSCVGRFWRNIIPPSVTALATGSSMAAIPSNLQAADRIGVPRDISEVVIPIGATLHMEGSCLAAVLKIAFLFGIFRIPFSGIEPIATALGIALLTGVVVSGIPGGGTIGELLILSLYGFPPEAFALVTMIGTLVDAPATMLNAVGDNVSSMLVARVLGGRGWMENQG
ncbi:dicarboxylate/amino acid:cation symporter [Pelobacter propionicus]|uniref:Sodium:dicarboxylate symporter n=1 Tax=Pelobacter propionicus (strain DSM 2379 / NBRC 103807 / OttBd1) TaxID=338966 RepID=A1ALF7_PELPD|nr:dicarboxylate/amino acid:cation symporter [Pelobacter propionicus]ABK98177.1 sodium:dicarboxylate symporter [Pelobacter propionicus DSM 2379]